MDLDTWKAWLAENTVSEQPDYYSVYEEGQLGAYTEDVEGEDEEEIQSDQIKEQKNH
jgi:hypothetical protein